MRCKTGQAQRVWEVEGTHPAPSKPKLRKGLWSPVEDNQLTNYILREGLVGCWNYVAKQAGLQRTGKSCRLRWINYLRPGLKRHPISRQEEQLIIKLQSILGNRWSQIAAQLPGRTDNEIKNYWNSCIRKKLWLKPYSSSSTAITNGNINSKFNHPFRSDRIGNANSMPSDVHFGVTSPRSAQPYLELMTEGHQPSNSAFNVVMNGDYQLCVPGYLEFKQEQSQDQNDEILIDPKPTNNLLNSYSQLWNTGNSTHTHGRFSTNADFMSSSLQHQAWHNYKAGRSATTNELTIESCRTTVANHEAPPSTNNCSVDSIRIAIPALAERQLLKENIENDGQINQNLIMDDYSSLTVSSISSSWSAGHSYECMAADFADFYPGVSYTTNEHKLLGIRILEDQLDGHKSYQLPYTEGAGDGIGNQLGCSRISNQEANVKPITAIFSGGTGGLEIHEYNGVAGQVTVWAQDDMYNISNATASEIFM